MYSGKLIRVAFILQIANKLIFLRKPFIGVSAQNIIVFTWQCHISIIIPWNEAMMTHCTQHRTRYHIVTQMMLTANFVNSLQNSKNNSLHISRLIKRYSFLSILFLKHGAKLLLFFNLTPINGKIMINISKK